MNTLVASRSVAWLLLCIFAAGAATDAAADITQAVCNSVAGLCAVPVSQTLWLGSHNSMAIYGELACLRALRGSFANQAAPVSAQLDAGVRVLNLDADLKAGAPTFTHGFCANGGMAPTALFDQLGAWLRGHPSETLVLNFDDNERGGDGAEAVSAQRKQMEDALAASSLGRLVFSKGPVTPTTLMADVRGKAVVSFDAGGWAGGGGAATSSNGVWLKAWSEFESDQSYVNNAALAVRSADAVADQLVSNFESDGWAAKAARCGGVPFRSLSFGSSDWR